MKKLFDALPAFSGMVLEESLAGAGNKKIICDMDRGAIAGPAGKI